MNTPNVIRDESVWAEDPDKIDEVMPWHLVSRPEPSEPVVEKSPEELEEENEQRVRDFIRTQRLDAFKEQCPREFRTKIDRALIPNVMAWDEADDWDGTHPGLWLWSHETGKGKTRMLWRQFGRLHVQYGRSILKATGQQLAEEYFGYHMEGRPRAFYRWVMGYDIVMLDDLDKIDMTDRRAPRMCRELFDELYAHHKPVLVTSNESIEHFEKKIGPSSARRMTSVCREVQF